LRRHTSTELTVDEVHQVVLDEVERIHGQIRDACEAVLPGMVAVQQAARTDLGWSPHVHALANRGGWSSDSRWVPVPYVDPVATEKPFRHKVMSFLMERGLLSEERARLISSWRRSGFSVHTAKRRPEGGWSGGRQRRDRGHR